MKKSINILIAICCIAIFGCEESKLTAYESDSINPGEISNVVAKPITGGVVLTYKQPSDEDLMCVKAIFKLPNGEFSETRSSVYNSKITIRGFADTLVKSVTLITIDKSLNESKGITIKFKPLEAPFYTLANNIKLFQAFGGIRLDVVNPEKLTFGLALYKTDKKGKLVLFDTKYITADTVEHYYRGLDTLKTKFHIKVVDTYYNSKKSKEYTITPLFETRITSEEFKKVILNNDDNWDAWAGDYYNIWSDNKDKIVHTHTSDNPSIITIDLGGYVRLSRFKLQFRKGFQFEHGNPKKFGFYGLRDLPAGDDDAKADLDNWINYGLFEAKQPSKNGGSVEDDDYICENGFEFNLSKTEDYVRYVRLAVFEVYKANYVDFAYLKFWGIHEKK